MVKPFPLRAAGIFLSGALALLSGACGGENPERSATGTANSAQPAPPATPAPAAKPKPAASPVNQLIDDAAAQKSCELALDKAASAEIISQSAQSASDWQLVDIQWQQAIALLSAAPKASASCKLAKIKIAQYQRNIASGKKPVAGAEATGRVPAAPGLRAPEVFRAPIKRRIAGTAVVEVTFNGKHTFEMIVDTGASGTVITPPMANKLRVVPQGALLVDTPSAKGVKFSTGRVNSIEVAGAAVRDVRVAIAPQLDMGLLGQDFFSHFDVTFKQDVVEFHTR
ncbi:retropepsin-like aspartic protease family protein [Kamptonema formosum]|uniref:retropepsin-like aspartic protease family protein n=1 Tax=Kamptonema formosum TaxID=331992 RepID=UPI00034A098B|nr:retropepsin-like aspartic protease [Oscillatoria sp. PCC 10802]